MGSLVNEGQKYCVKLVECTIKSFPEDDILKWSKEKFDQEPAGNPQITASEIAILEQLLGFE
jgi:hypothetical protein